MPKHFICRCLSPADISVDAKSGGVREPRKADCGCRVFTPSRASTFGDLLSPWETVPFTKKQSRLFSLAAICHETNSTKLFVGELLPKTTVIRIPFLTNLVCMGKISTVRQLFELNEWALAKFLTLAQREQSARSVRDYSENFWETAKLHTERYYSMMPRHCMPNVFYMAKWLAHQTLLLKVRSSTLYFFFDASISQVFFSYFINSICDCFSPFCEPTNGVHVKVQ